MTTWATERLDELRDSTEPVLPPLIRSLGLGTLDLWEPGLVRKHSVSQLHPPI